MIHNFHKKKINKNLIRSCLYKVCSLESGTNIHRQSSMLIYNLKLNQQTNLNLIKRSRESEVKFDNKKGCQSGLAYFIKR